MFNWLGSIFVIVSGIALFVGWSRAIRLRDHIKTAQSQHEWALFRMFVLFTLVGHIVLLIMSVIGLERAFAWLAAIFFIVESVTFFFAMNFIRGLQCIPQPKKEQEQEKGAPE